MCVYVGTIYILHTHTNTHTNVYTRYCNLISVFDMTISEM